MKTGKLTQISSKEIISNYRCDLALPEVFFRTSIVERDSIVYKVGYVVQTGKAIDDTPEFALITDIFVHEEKIFLGCQTLSVLGFSTHFHAFRVEKENLNFVKSTNILDTRASYLFEGVRDNYVMWD